MLCSKKNLAFSKEPSGGSENKSDAILLDGPFKSANL